MMANGIIKSIVYDLRLATSPGQHRVLTSILVGILTGNVTHGSSSPTALGP